MTARDEILSRIRSALDVADPSVVRVPRAYREWARTHSPEDLLNLFVERVEEYRAAVTRCAEREVVETVARLMPENARVVLAPELPWRIPGDRDSGFAADELDRYDAVVTAAGVGIAETGTIVLSHTPAEGRRALSLVPDLHVCVLRADQVLPDVPAAVATLDPLRPQTWISGPSATSDIELNRIEGVHGPRLLHVILIG